MFDIRRRLERLEAEVSTLDEKEGFLRLLISGGKPLVDAFRDEGDDLVEIADLATCGLVDDPFALERLRGIFPDKVLRDVYRSRRNCAYSKAVSQRVRVLGGHYDERGNLLPQFVLRDNGSIIDASEASASWNS